MISGEPDPGPSGSGTVVLELGPGSGALVLYAPAALDGAEIEISTDAASRTHSRVRPRHVAGGIKHAAVYPGLRPGHYTVWRDSCTPGPTVRITGGAITTVNWLDVSA
jgi:hypothetical protein